MAAGHRACAALRVLDGREHGGTLIADGRRRPRCRHPQTSGHSTPKRCHIAGSRRSGKRRAVYAPFLAAANNRLKQFRRIATRYEKRGVNYLAMVMLGMILLWL